MKLSSKIMAILILTLSFIPCQDGLIHDHSYGNQQSVITDYLHASHGELPGDLCSPFCSCHCCHIHVVVQTGGQYTNVHLFTDVQVSTDIGALESISNSLFHPPKV